MPSNAATVAAPTVHIASPPGEYRPGGTSSFTGLTTGPAQVATRPTEGMPPSAAPMTPNGLPSYPTDSNSGVQRY
jgi:hypothetical protein